MIFDFKNLDDKGNLKKKLDIIYDYILIGSGPASYVLFDYLNKKNKKILIIEKGSLDVSNSIKKKEKTSLISNDNYSIKKNSRISALGGTGNVWAGVSSYIEDFEMFSRWGKFKKLWPISHQEIINNYKKLDVKYGFKNLELLKNLKKTDRDNKIIRSRIFFAPTRPFKFNDSKHYKNCDLLINAKVSYLNEYKKVPYVELEDKITKVFSKKIIVCCGGLETNFLMLRSISNKRLKNTKNKNILGKFFMDHPKFQLGLAKIHSSNLNFFKKIILKKKNNEFCYKGISLSKKIQKEKKLLNSYARFEKYLLIELINKIKKNIFDISSYARILKLIYLEYFNKINLDEKYKITIYNEMVPSINNKITYKKKKNKDKFFIKFKFSKIEFKTIHYLINILIKKLGLKLQKNFKISKKFIEKSLQDSSHHMGGTIMGKSKKNSFVNKNLQIHGIKNIYICSTSVFPTSGSLNPTMTLCALAVRLANYLNKNN